MQTNPCIALERRYQVGCSTCPPSQFDTLELLFFHLSPYKSAPVPPFSSVRPEVSCFGKRSLSLFPLFSCLLGWQTLLVRSFEALAVQRHRFAAVSPATMHFLRHQQMRSEDTVDSCLDELAAPDSKANNCVIPTANAPLASF